MMNLSVEFEQLIQGQELDSSQVKAIITACVQGKLSETQLGVFLALMRMKGETINELTAATETLFSVANTIDLGDNLIDIVGTGGDGKSTFNVSTVSSFVAAASGLRVAKHGNVSVSSRSGSADFLLHAGFKLELANDTLKTSLNSCGIAFLFAPQFHHALRHARAARQQLGIRTLFNLLGPLLNPAQVKRQVVGVFPTHWQQPIAKVLANLGSQRSLVVCSQDGLDEISIAADTDVVELHHGEIKHWVIHPQAFGLNHTSLNAITVENPEQSLAMAKSVFAGEHSAARDIIILNAAAAIYCAAETLTYPQAIKTATEAIDSGEAGKRFTQALQLSQHHWSD